jgi:hypothetical protein
MHVEIIHKALVKPAHVQRSMVACRSRQNVCVLFRHNLCDFFLTIIIHAQPLCTHMHSFIRSSTQTTGRMPDQSGVCQCAGNHVKVGQDTCVPLSTLLPAILVPLGVLLALIFYMRELHMRREQDRVIYIDVSELIFPDPPKVRMVLSMSGTCPCPVHVHVRYLSMSCTCPWPLLAVATRNLTFMMPACEV